MIPILASNPKPINFQAAKIFWKAPWWATLIEEDKAEIIRIEVDEKRLVDYFRPPPYEPQKTHQIPDRRGTKIQFKNGDVCLVTGFSGASYKTVRGRGKPQKWFYMGKQYTSRTSNHTECVAQRWWIIKRGHFDILNWKGPAKFDIARPMTPLTPEGWQP